MAATDPCTLSSNSAPFHSAKFELRVQGQLSQVLCVLENATVNKWIIIFAIVLIVILLAFLSEKSVKTEITVPSNASSIWSVLMNTAQYKEWNPVLVPLSGQLAEGNTIRYQWNQANGEPIEIDSKVIELIENKLLHQRGGTPGVLTFDHRYELFEDGSKTKIVQSEVYRGIGVLFWDASQMEPQYSNVNKALLEQVIGQKQ